MPSISTACGTESAWLSKSIVTVPVFALSLVLSYFRVPSAGAESFRVSPPPWAAGVDVAVAPPPDELEDWSSPPQPAIANASAAARVATVRVMGLLSKVGLQDVARTGTGAAHNADRVIFAPAGGGVQDDISAAV